MPTVSQNHEGAAVSQSNPALATRSDGLATTLNFNVLGSLRKHWLLALAVALLFLSAGLPLAWVLGSPKYSATAVIYVSPRFVSNLGEGAEQKFDSATQYRDYATERPRTINRFDILLEAIERLGPQRAFWVNPGESMDRAAARLQARFVRRQVPG